MIRKNDREKELHKIENQFKDFQKAIGISFANVKLLKQAFTH